MPKFMKRDSDGQNDRHVSATLMPSRKMSTESNARRLVANRFCDRILTAQHHCRHLSHRYINSVPVERYVRSHTRLKLLPVTVSRWLLADVQHAPSTCITLLAVSAARRASNRPLHDVQRYARTWTRQKKNESYSDTRISQSSFCGSF